MMSWVVGTCADKLWGGCARLGGRCDIAPGQRRGPTRHWCDRPGAVHRWPEV